MSLKDTWKNKVDGVDDVLADDINNIAHAVIGNEKNISNKVSKEDGKGLSSNDFTNEYKNKVDNFKSPVQSVAGKIGDVVLDKNDVGLSQVDNTSDLDKPISNATQQALDTKANKADIVDVYKYIGSVPTFDDLPYKYEIIPDGLPVIHSENAEIDGSVWGTFDEETHTVTVNPATLDTDTVTIPVVPITIPAGVYWSNEHKIGYMDIGQLSTYGCNIFGKVWDNKSEYLINEISCFVYDMEHASIGGTADSFTLYKLVRDWCSYDNGLQEYVFWNDFPDGAYDNGAIYKVLDTGMHYAWNGTEWDALGGEHKDLEAREDIEALETQMGDIETALDSIIKIQNSLIGGESV